MAKKSNRMIQQETTVGAAVADAFSEFEQLQSEMQDWFDNMPENLQSGSKGDQVQEAADALSNISEPSVDEKLAELKVTYASDMKAKSRNDRRNEVVNMLNAVIEALDAEHDRIDTDETDKQDHDRQEAIETLKDEVQQMIDEAEAVEFPGMFG